MQLYGFRFCPPMPPEGDSFMPQQNKRSSDRLVQAAKDYIVQHSKEKFSLQELADSLFVNKSYLLRLFKSRTGHTLLGYHNRVRCEEAARMLVDSHLSISEVGEAAGFVSSSHFTHVFKKTLGVTPTEYRSLHGSDTAGVNSFPNV